MTKFKTVRNETFQAYKFFIIDVILCLFFHENFSFSDTLSLVHLMNIVKA